MAQTGLESIKTVHIGAQPTSCVVAAVSGSFSSPHAANEVILAKPDAIELVHIANGALRVVNRTSVFAQVRAMATLASGDATIADSVIVSADSGRLNVLRYDALSATWSRVAVDAYGKSGVRRCVPGHFVVADPRGRSIMIAALEKQKFVYGVKTATRRELMPPGADEDDGVDSLSGDADDVVVQLSSAIEAHKSGACVLDCVAVDNAGENPQFACLEHCDSVRSVVVYEHDTGLGHVVRLWSLDCSATATMLSGLAAATDVPPGCVLVSCEDVVTAVRFDGRQVRRTSATLPRRSDYPFAAGGVLVNHVAQVKVKGNRCFMLLQNELGDLFRMSLHEAGDRDVLTLRYFDTVEISSAMVLLRQGVLFSAGESSDHAVYKVIGDGPADDSYLECTKKFVVGAARTKLEIPIFKRRPVPDNLIVQTRSRNVGPVAHSCAAGSTTCFASGHMGSSALATLRAGHTSAAEVTLALPFQFESILALWDPQAGDDAPVTSHVIATSSTGSLVFGASSTQEGFAEDSTSGFVTSVRTIAAATLSGGGGVVQVHTDGLRHIASTDTYDWAHAFQKSICCAAANSLQVVAVFQHGGMSLFEFDAMTQRISETATDNTAQAVSSVCLAPPPRGAFKALHAGVASHDEFHVMSVDPSAGSLLGCVSKRLRCRSNVTSAAIIRCADGGVYAFVAKENGSVVRVTMNERTGELVAVADSDPLNGSNPSFIAAAHEHADSVMITCGNAVFRAGFVDGMHHIVPLALAGDSVGRQLMAVTAIRTSRFPTEHVAALADQKLMCVLNVDTSSAQHLDRLYTANIAVRRLTQHPNHEHIVVALECEHRASQAQPQSRDACRPPTMPQAHYSWQLRSVDTRTMATRALVAGTLQSNASEAAISLAAVQFAERRGATFVVVGVVPRFGALPLAFDPTHLPVMQLFALEGDGALRLQHSTTVDNLPTALAPFPHTGALAAGCGRSVRLYALGSKQLLRKCEVEAAKTSVVHIAAHGELIVAGDAHESIVVIKYFAPTKSDASALAPMLVVFAEDCVPRHVTAVAFVDPQSCAVADRFGNVSVLRLAPSATSAADALADASLAEKQSPTKLAEVMAFHVGQVVVALQQVRVGDGVLALQYTTALGATGFFVPVCDDDFEHMRLIESALRDECVPLVGREHVRFRSTFTPSVGVVDADFIETAWRHVPASSKVQFDSGVRDQVEYTRSLRGGDDAKPLGIDHVLRALHARAAARQS